MPIYTCQHCHKNVKDLASHLKRVHPDVTVISGKGLMRESGYPQQKIKDLGDYPTQDLEKDKADNSNAETLEIQAPPGADASTYHCVDCGGPLTKGQTPCPSCGKGMDWGAVA